MTSPDFVTIGHLTADLLPDKSYRPGGTVSFAAELAHNLGQQAAIVTATSAKMREAVEQKSIIVVGPIVGEPTVFENIYTTQGRIQYVRAVAPQIEPSAIPLEWTGPQSQVEIVHLGPVAQEFAGPELIELFPNALIGVTPQGWLRAWDESGRVRPIIWQQPEKVLRHTAALVLSNEDLPSGAEGRELLDYYIKLTPIVVMTQGPNGCFIFQNGEKHHVPAFKAQEIDPTGAGDVFAAAFFIKLRETNDALYAARFAHAAAACNIEKPGLAGVPTLAQVQKRLARES